MPSLIYFRKEIRIERVRHSSEEGELETTTHTGIKAVTVDEQVNLPWNQKTSLYDAVGCGNFRCCDYILPKRKDGGEKQLHFIEVSNLKLNKSNLQKKYGNIEDDETRNEIVEREIFQEYILKAYGSLVILYRLPIISEINWGKIAQEDRDTDREKKTVLSRKAVFCIVVNDADFEEDIRAFDSLRDSLTDGLHPPVSEVRILRKEDFMGDYCGGSTQTRELPQHA